MTPGECLFHCSSSLRKAFHVRGLRETLGYLVLRKAGAPSMCSYALWSLRWAVARGFCFLSRSEESEAQTGWPASMRESSSTSAALHRHAPRGPKHVQCMPRPHPSCSALFRPLTHLGEPFSLIPFLPLPLIMKPPLGAGGFWIRMPLPSLRPFAPWSQPQAEQLPRSPGQPGIVHSRRACRNSETSCFKAGMCWLTWIILASMTLVLWEVLFGSIRVH